MSRNQLVSFLRKGKLALDKYVGVQFNVKSKFLIDGRCKLADVCMQLDSNDPLISITEVIYIAKTNTTEWLLQLILESVQVYVVV